MVATTTANCGGFFNLRSNPNGGKVQSSPAGGCGKLDGVGMWFINGVASAFFASLERCSCIRIATVDDVADGNSAPLILNDGNVSHGGGRRRTTKGKKQTGPFDEY